MKKILTVSVLAMMAVTAANAEIASRAYVDAQDTAVSNKIGTLDNLETTAKNNVVAAINEIRTTANGGQTQQQVADAISAALEPYSTTAESDAAYATAAQGTTADSAIQTVKVNGTALTPDANKAVDVTVPTGALASKSTIANADVASDAAIADSKIAATGSIASGNGGLVTGGTVYTALQDYTPTASLDSTFATDSELSTALQDYTPTASLADIATSGSYADLTVADGAIAQSKVNGLGTAASANVADSIAENGTGLATAGQVYTAVNNAQTAAVSNLDLAADAQSQGTGNVIVSVSQSDGQLAATKGYAINTVNAATGNGNVVSGIAVNATNANQLDVTTITAIPKPDGNCTDCVLHFNGTAYSWEEIARGSGE